MAYDWRRMDQDIKDTLIGITESLISVAHTAFCGHEMAWGCYQMMVVENPQTAPARFRRALHGAGKLTRERDEQTELLQALLRKLKTV